ncbi:hypothetical protein C0991_006487 [Blastosporella zonata]|nr:hypothetical protein C0991_006487 [Blastosporella zonata]
MDHQANLYDSYAEAHARRKQQNLEEVEAPMAVLEENTMSSIADHSAEDIELDMSAPIDTSEPEDAAENMIAASPEPKVGPIIRSVRQRRKTWKLLELLPDPPSPIALSTPLQHSPEDHDKTLYWYTTGTRTPRQRTHLDFIVIIHVYQHTIQMTTSLLLISPISMPLLPPEPAVLSAGPAPAAPPIPSYYPFSNSSVFGLMHWMWMGSAWKNDIKNFDVKAETARLDALLEEDNGEELGFAKDGWREVDVPIKVPYGKSATSSDIPTFRVPGLHFRKLVDVLKSVVHDAAASCHHYTPFKQFWKPDPTSKPLRIYDEMYSLDAFINEYIKLQQQAPEPGCNLEHVLPDSFNNFYESLAGEAPSADVLTHCRRELMHSVWQIILDNDFLYAYEHGIVIQCPDGMLHRFYSRIFTYSADYPEK